MGTKNTRESGKLTAAQMENIVRVSCEISDLKKILRTINPVGNCAKTIVFRSVLNQRPVAVTTFKDQEVRDENGDRMTTICDPQLFDVITEYFQDKKNLLVEEIEEVVKEAKEGGCDE